MFMINKFEPIGIYGGGKVGKAYAERLLAAGYNVTGIIDKNPSVVEGAPVHVFTLDEYFNQFQSAFIWVSLGSGLEHHAVAKKINKKGYTRILFLPIQLRSITAKKMIDAFNNFISGEYETFVPYYNELFTCDPYEYILSDNESFITAMIPIEHVYSSNPHSTKNNQNPYNIFFAFNSQHKEDDPGYDVPIASLNYKLEIDFNLHGNIYNELYENALFDFSFFINGATAVFLTGHNKFNIIDGGHRALFLASKGFTGVPCRVPKADWVKYFNQDKALLLMDYVKELGFLPRKVIHPAFMLFPVKSLKRDEKFEWLYEVLIHA